MNSQNTKSEKCDFRFSLKINNLQLLILVAPPCATGTSELIRGSIGNIEVIKLWFTGSNNVNRVEERKN